MAFLKNNFFKKSQTPLAVLIQRFDDALKLEDRLDTLFLMKGISNEAFKAKAHCGDKNVKGYEPKHHDQFASLQVKAAEMNKTLQQEITVEEVLKSKRLPDFMSFYVDGAGILRDRLYGSVLKARMPSHDAGQVVGHWKIKL